MPAVPRFVRCAVQFFSRAAVASLALVPSAHAQFVNDPGGEPVGANQSYPSLAWLDGILVAAYADFRTGETQRIRCSYSVDSGATWIPLGIPPAPGTARWVTDPRVVASPVHGKFFVFGGANDYPLNGALFACVPLSFPGGAPTWGVPQTVRITGPDSYLTLVFSHDAAVSPTTGRLFAASPYYDPPDPTHLDLQYSDDQGQTWSAPHPVDSVGTFPRMRVHGDRVYLMNGIGTPAYIAVTAVAGPSWWHVGRTPKARDAMSPGLAISSWTNTFAIDDSIGAYHGRIYAAWTESYDYTDDPVPDPLSEAGAVSEAEPNDTFAEAATFAIGDVLRGQIATSNTDLDYFGIHLEAGQRVILWADSVGAAFTSLFVQAYDSLGLRPAWFAAQIQKSGRLTFVAPRSDEYGFRLSGSFTGGVAQGYRVRTAPGFAGSEPAADQCDVVTAWSDDQGATWSAPVRATTTAIGVFDDGPVLGTGPDRVPVAGWWWRTPTHGVMDPRWRLMRSNDGGATWQLGGRPTQTPVGTTWAQFSGGSVWGVNDMVALPGRIVHAFAELQATSPVNTDVRAAIEIRRLVPLSCWIEFAGRAGEDFYPFVSLRNDDEFFAEPIELRIQFERDWPQASVPASVPAGAEYMAAFWYAIPDTAATGDVRFDLVVVHRGAGIMACPCLLHVEGGLDVPGGGAVAFGLLGAWPNPVSRTARVRYGVSGPTWVTLDVLDVHGRRVARLADHLHEAGTHDTVWDGRGGGGEHLPPGIYLLELRAGTRRDVRRLVLLN